MLLQGLGSKFLACLESSVKVFSEGFGLQPIPGLLLTRFYKAVIASLCELRFPDVFERKLVVYAFRVHLSDFAISRGVRTLGLRLVAVYCAAAIRSLSLVSMTWICHGKCGFLMTVTDFKFLAVTATQFLVLRR